MCNTKIHKALCANFHHRETWAQRLTGFICHAPMWPFSTKLFLCYYVHYVV